MNNLTASFIILGIAALLIGCIVANRVERVERVVLPALVTP